MNFRKTTLLLIIMSLFLLISIGFVCAEDINADADVQTTVDGTVSIIAGDEGNTGTNQELINTTVTTDKTAYKVGESDDKNISVTVKDNKSNEIKDVSGSNFTVFEGTNSLNFKYNNSIITVTNDLSVGNHSIVINYLGNNVYNNSTTTFILGVYGNKTLEQPLTPVNSNGTVVEVPIIISDGVDAFDFTTDDLTLNLTYVDNEGNKTSKIVDYTVENKTIKFILDNTQFVSANLNITYNGDNSSKIVNIKKGTQIIVENIALRDNENKTIPISIDSIEKINITDENLKITEGSTELKYTHANDAITINSTLEKGKHNITIKYLGNSAYGESTKDIVVSVYGNTTIETPASINVNSTKKGEIKVNITNGVNITNFTKEDISINVTYKNGNDTVEIKLSSLKVENGIITFELENGDFTTATFNIVYMPEGISKNVTLNRTYNVNIIPINTEVDYGDGNFTFKLIDLDDANLVLANKTVKISGKNSAGTALYFIKSSGNSYNINQDISLTSDKDGIVCLKNENFYPGLSISTVIYAPADRYIMTVTGLSGVNGTNTTNVTINKIDANIKLETYNEYYGSDKKVTITVTNAKTGKGVANVYILLEITGATLSSPNQITNENGKIQLGVNGLPVGTYKLKMVSNDTNINNKTVSSSFTVKRIPITISTSNVKIYYNTGTTATIKIIDKRTKKAIANAYVVFKIGSTEYKLATNKKGTISIGVPLNVGTHKITVSKVYMIYNNTLRDVYDYSKVTKTITVKKASAKITAKKVTGYYKQGKKFTIKLTNKKNGKAIYFAKLKIRIYFSKAYSLYTYNTGADGKISIPIDLPPGTYKVEVIGGSNKNFAAKKVTSKITIKKAPTKLIPKKLTSKKGKNNYFKVTVKNKKTKKVIAGVKVKVKIYTTGKKPNTVTVKTNSKGIAKVNVKSLKVGTHKVVVTSANKYCVAKTAKSTIKITK